MNKKLILLLLAALTTLFLACSKDDENTPDSNDPEIALRPEYTDPNIERTIKLSVKVDNDYKTVRFRLDFDLDDPSYHNEFNEHISESIAFPKDLSINWGDGKTTFSDTHEYKNSGTYNITITCKNIKYFEGDDILAIDVKECKSLVALYLEWFNGNDLDLSNNKALKYLYIEPARLKSLNLNDCPALEFFRLYPNSPLASLEINKCSMLKHLDVGNSDVTSLDVSGCSKLEYLKCDSLTSLNVSGCTALRELYCSGKMTFLDVSKCPNLKHLNCNYSRSLTTLKLNTAIEELYCSDCNLTSLNINNCSNLKQLSCSYNKLNTNALNEIFNALPIPIDYNYDSYYVYI